MLLIAQRQAAAVTALRCVKGGIPVNRRPTRYSNELPTAETVLRIPHTNRGRAGDRGHGPRFKDVYAQLTPFERRELMRLLLRRAKVSDYSPNDEGLERRLANVLTFASGDQTGPGRDEPLSDRCPAASRLHSPPHRPLQIWGTVHLGGPRRTTTCFLSEVTPTGARR